MAVVPSGKISKSGRIIWKAAPVKKERIVHIGGRAYTESAAKMRLAGKTYVGPGELAKLPSVESYIKKEEPVTARVTDIRYAGKVTAGGVAVPLAETLRPEVRFKQAYAAREAGVLSERLRMKRAGYAERIEKVAGGERIIFEKEAPQITEGLYTKITPTYTPTPKGAIRAATTKERFTKFVSGSAAEALEKQKGIIPKLSAFSSAAIGETIQAGKSLYSVATKGPKAVRTFMFLPTKFQYAKAKQFAFGVGYGAGLIIKEAPKKPITTVGKAAPYLIIGGAISAGERLSMRLAKPKVKLVSDVEMTGVRLGEGKKQIRVEPIDYTVQLGKTVMKGRGAGEAAVLQAEEKAVVKGVFRYETLVKKPTVTELGYKGKFVTEKGFMKGTGIYEAITRVPKRKPAVMRGISVVKAREFVGGDFPKYVFKTGELTVGERRPTLGRFGMIRKEAEWPATLVGKSVAVEKWSVLEAGAGPKVVRQMFPPTKPYPRKLLVSKRAELMLESPTTVPKPVFLETEPLVGAEFLRGIGRAAKAELIKEVPKRAYVFSGITELGMFDVALREREKLKVEQITEPITKQRVNLFQITKTVSVFDIGEKGITKPMFDVASVTGLKEKMRQTTVQELKVGMPPVPPPITVIFPPPPPIVVVPPFFPAGFDLLKRTKRPKKGKLRRERFAYTPSVEAIYMGIYGSKKGITAPSLQFRPMLKV